jgi:hypothetical protein
MEQHVLDTNAGKQLTVLNFHRCLINTGVEEMDNVNYNFDPPDVSK